MTATQLELSELKRDWIEEAGIWFDRIAGQLGEFTSDDLHAYLPEPEQPNWMGALCARLRCAGRIVEVGRRKSTRPEANGRKVTLWRVVR